MNLNEYNSRLVDSAREDDTAFVYYFVGWMTAINPAEAAKCAEVWMERQNPDKLERFKSENKKDLHDKEEEVQEN